MDREIVLALVAIAPQVLVLLIIVIGALVFRGQIGKTIGGRVTSVSVFGLRMDLDADAVDKAVAEKASSVGSAPAPAVQKSPGSVQVVERAARLADHLQGLEARNEPGSSLGESSSGRAGRGLGPSRAVAAACPDSAPRLGSLLPCWKSRPSSR